MKLAWAGLGLGLVVVAGSVALGVDDRAAPVHRGVVPVATIPARPSTAPVLAQGSVPSHLTIAGLRVTAPVTAVAVGPGGDLGVPDDPRTVGWWAGGALPGSTEGTVVLDGHVDTAAAGAGALFDLRNVEVGDMATLAGDPESTTYRIRAVREYHKGQLPTQDLFDQTGAPRLVLITCGGPFDTVTHHYRDNIVAYGVQVSSGQTG